MKLRNKMALCMAIVFVLFTIALGVAVAGMRDANTRFGKFIEQDQAFLAASNSLYAQGLQSGQALRNIILAPSNETGYKNLAASREAFRKALQQAQSLAAADPAAAQRLAKIQATSLKQAELQDQIVVLAKQDQASAIAKLNGEETPLWRQVRGELIDIIKSKNEAVDAAKAELAASTFACWTLSVLVWTVDVSSSIDAAVSSSELACSSVRADRSMLPAAISPDAVVIVSVPLRTLSTSCARPCCIVRMACIRLPAFFSSSTSMAAVRSPAAIPAATAAA
jgi:CHASE3 domain sensor protein